MAIGATILGLSGPVLTRDEAAFLREADPWGLILFARNVESPAQLRALTQDLRACLGRAAPVLIDQEGGRVQRLRAPHWREWPAPLDQARALAPEQRPRAAWLRHRLIAAELRGLGIDANCAPGCDIAGPATHPFLQNRCWGFDAASVIAQARPAAEAMLAGGVLPIIKHLPGHGRATADSHLHLPEVTAPLADLLASDFAPFAALADLPLAMTAHVVYRALDPRPATISPVMIAQIRETIGFQGLLMTDDIAMQALAGDLAGRAAAALAAGCDVVLHCSGDLAEMQAVAQAAGGLSQAASTRAAAALSARILPEPVDLTALSREFAQLLQQDA